MVTLPKSVLHPHFAYRTVSWSMGKSLPKQRSCLTRLIACARGLKKFVSVLYEQSDDIVHSPLVAAAWSLTAFLSRLKALSSAPCKPLVSVLANLRWKANRVVGERNATAARSIVR
jgi:hypothetical protein